MSDLNFLSVVGPTSSGKSELGLFLAEKLNGEIVSCDSVQIYRGFDIGAAKPSTEECRRVPHHMINIADANDNFDAGDYAKQAANVISEISKRKKLPILVGGTGLYLRALCGDQWDNVGSDPKVRQSFASESLEALYKQLQTLDPERAEQLHPNDRFRIERALEIITITGKPVSAAYSSHKTSKIISPTIFLNIGMTELDERIKIRTRLMLKKGLIEETKEILKELGSARPKVMNSIGYFEAMSFISGSLEGKDLETTINIATHQYAKRQKTWFRKTGASIMLCSSPRSENVLELAKILVDKF